MLGTAAAEMPGGVLVPANKYRNAQMPYVNFKREASHA